MVLIEVRNSKGVVGRCDANCYRATGETCTCVCGGINHGAGLLRAIANTQQLTAKWPELIKGREWEMCVLHVVSLDEPVQLEMPF
jgi:hypothetical protein